MRGRLLLAVCAIAVTPVLLACGGDGGDDDTTPGGNETPGGSPTASGGGPAPTQAKPASKFSISIDDLGQNFRTDIQNTFVLDAKTYAHEASVGTTRVRLFSTESQGSKLLADWGYIDGYQTGYIPEGVSGPESALLSGGFYITVESHLFKDPEGALDAYDHFVDFLETNGAKSATAPVVGNKSSAWETTGGKIGKTEVLGTYHQLVFVRGNVMTIVLTKGAQGFAKVDTVVALGRIADEKILGQRNATEPTPTSNFQTATPATRE